MNRIKKFVCLLSVAALLFTCSGCDIPTLIEQLDFTPVHSKEAVLLKLTEYVNGRTPTSADVSLQFELSSTLNDAPVTTKVFVDGNVKIASETNSYAEGTISYTINDVETETSVQVYNFEEEGNLVTFTHTDATDKWLKTELPLPEPTPVVTPAPVTSPDVTAPEEDAKPELVVPETYKFLLLEEGTQTVNDTEVYTLTGTVSGEDCKNFLLNSLNLGELTARMQTLAKTNADLANIDYSLLSADVVVYLNKQDFSPMQIELAISGANRLLNSILPLLPTQATTVLGNAISTSPIRVVLSDIGFDPVTVPTISDEARILALQESFNPNQGDGSYVLLRYMDAVKITPQSGFTPSELAPTYATFRNANNTCAIHCELYKGMSADEFVASVENGLIPAMEAAELIPVSAAEEAIGEYQTHSITSNGVNIFIASRTFGDSLLGIYVEDNTGTPIASVLTPLLNAIEEYHVEY